MTTAEDKTVWLRPEYQGREDELLAIADIAELADTDPKQVRWWFRSQDSFPDPVKELPVGNGPKRWFVAAEIASWLVRHRPRQTAQPEAARLRVKVAAMKEQISQLEAELARARTLRDQIEGAIGERL